MEQIKIFIIIIGSHHDSAYLTEKDAYENLKLLKIKHKETRIKIESVILYGLSFNDATTIFKNADNNIWRY
jgi:hypothetical protein